MQPNFVSCTRESPGPLETARRVLEPASFAETNRAFDSRQGQVETNDLGREKVMHALLPDSGYLVTPWGRQGRFPVPRSTPQTDSSRPSIRSPCTRPSRLSCNLPKQTPTRLVFRGPAERGPACASAIICNRPSHTMAVSKGFLTSGVGATNLCVGKNISIVINSY